MNGGEGGFRTHAPRLSVISTSSLKKARERIGRTPQNFVPMMPNNPNRIKVFRQFDSDNFNGYKVWWVISAWALRTHLGLRPKPRASSLAHSLLIAGNEAPEKGQDSLILHVFFDKAKGRSAHTRRGPSFRRTFFPCSCSSPSRGVLGRSPKWELRAKAEWR